MQKISVVGLGKLGSPLLVAIAARGFEVIGVDTNETVVKLINRSKTPVNEPGLQELLTRNARRIKATTNYQDAIKNTDITLVIVPTPSNDNGDFSNRFVLSAVDSIGNVLKEKNSYHLVVVASTVLPMSMDSQIVPQLLKSSGKKLNRDFGICYNPEFIALGQVINDLLSPDFVLIGQSDEKAGQILEGFYRKFCTNKPSVIRMNFINAEITKIALNSYITTKISFVNNLAQICQLFPGGDVDTVTNALGHDLRVGSRYLKGAVSYGGPCFPRDNRAFTYFAQKVKVATPIAEATDKFNNQLIYNLARKVTDVATGKSTKVSILGLAYKPDTDVAEESAGVKIAALLSKKKIEVSVWDPQALESARTLLPKSVQFAQNLRACLKGSNVIILATPWKEFKKIKIPKSKISSSKPILVDCWRILNPIKYKKVVDYRTIGQERFSLK